MSLRRKRATIALAASALGLGLALPAQAADVGSGWRAVYKHGPDGKPLAGSKAQLIDAIRQGLPVRVGFGLKASGSDRSVEHVLDADWIELLDGNEVMVQIDGLTQRRFVKRSSPVEMDFGDPKAVWVGMLVTTGELDAAWINRGTGEVIEHHPPQRATATWYVDAPGAAAGTPPPLWEQK